MSESIIQIQHLTKTFGTGEGAVHALEDINLDIKQGEIFGIIGLSGAGKSTLVRVAFNGGTAYQPLIASLAIDCGVKVNILGADTRNIDGKAFGTMLLGLPDDPNEAAKALSYIRAQPNVTAEEVEYHA